MIVFNNNDQTPLYGIQGQKSRKSINVKNELQALIEIDATVFKLRIYQFLWDKQQYDFFLFKVFKEDDEDKQNIEAYFLKMVSFSNPYIDNSFGTVEAKIMIIEKKNFE